MEWKGRKMDLLKCPRMPTEVDVEVTRERAVGRTTCKRKQDIREARG